MLTIAWNNEGRKLEKMHYLVSHRIYTQRTELLWWLCSSCRAYVEDDAIYTRRGKQNICIGRIADVSIN